MGTGASATQVIRTASIAPEDDSPASKVSVTKITPIVKRPRKTSTVKRVDSFERQFREEEQKAFTKTLEAIFGGEPAETSEPKEETVREIRKIKNAPETAEDSSDADSKLDLVVLLSSEDIRNNNKRDLTASVPSFEDTVMDELSSLANDIDDALEGHDEVMQELRGLSLMSTVSSYRGSFVSVEGPNVLRPKGSTISPLPGVIPVRVNWANSEKITEQEKLLNQRAEAEKTESLEHEKLVETSPMKRKVVAEPQAQGEVKVKPKQSAGAGDRQEESPGPAPRVVAARVDYTNEERDLMRTIEKEFASM